MSVSVSNETIKCAQSPRGRPACAHESGELWHWELSGYHPSCAHFTLQPGHEAISLAEDDLQNSQVCGGDIARHVHGSITERWDASR